MTPSIEIAAREFLLACRADGLAATTIRWYRHMLKPLIARLYGKPVETITVDQLRLYVVDLRERGRRYVGARQRPELDGGLSLESIRDHIGAMKRFVNWCWEEYELEIRANPARRIKTPRHQAREPKAIALEDLRRLLEATDDTPAGLRDRAMICFLADTGCRAGGLLSLELGNLHISSKLAIVTEKGNRSRAVPFTDYTADAILAWLSEKPEPGKYVFCALGGRKPGQALTLAGLHFALKRLKKRAGVVGRVNPHSFRHGFAREYLRNGGDVATLSQLMGHGDVGVTVDSYARFAVDELAEQHSRFSPMVGIAKGERQ